MNGDAFACATIDMLGRDTDAGVQRAEGERVGYLVSVCSGWKRPDGIGDGRRCSAKVDEERLGMRSGFAEEEKKEVLMGFRGEGEAAGESTCIAWNVFCTSRSISTSAVSPLVDTA